MTKNRFFFKIKSYYPITTKRVTSAIGITHLSGVAPRQCTCECDLRRNIAGVASRRDVPQGKLLGLAE